MSTPVPVPSKAAIRALRGLVLGTTCTLALMTEDRRRRINAARTAISNGDRIRSSRQYRADGAAIAISAKEEEALMLDSWPYPRRHPLPSDGSSMQPMLVTGNVPPEQFSPYPANARMSGMDALETHLHGKQSEHGPVDMAEMSPTVGTQNSSGATTTPVSAPQRPRTAFARQPWGARIQMTPQEATAVPVSSSEEIKQPQQQLHVSTLRDDVAALSAMCATPDPRSLDLGRAVDLLLDILVRVGARPKRKQESYMHEVQASSAFLSRECQQAGNMDGARKILEAIIGAGKLEEEAYFAHDPLPIVEATIPDFRGGPNDPGRRNKLALDLFMPMLYENPDRSRAVDVLATAEKVIQGALAKRKPSYVDRVLNRVRPYLEGPGAYGFLGRVFRGMHEIGMFKPVVQAFLACDPAVARPKHAQYLEVGDLVVQCVAEAHGARAGEVLNRLRVLRPKGTRLHTRWVSELVKQDWKANKDYEHTMELFARLRRSSEEEELEEEHRKSRRRRENAIPDTVSNPEGAYWAIIRVALDAGEEAAAQRLFAELKALSPDAKNDVAILGLFALSRARAGDWVGVQSIFKKMSFSKGGLSTPHGTKAFFPILKVFSESHTVLETEQLLKALLDEFRIPLDGHVVMFMANKYGDSRDVPSFLSWLDYCAGIPGLELDSAFTNAILRNCRQNWKFSFVDLRAVYRRLRKLVPNSCDETTEHIMTGAALATPVPSGKVSVKLVNSLQTRHGTTTSAVRRRLHTSDPVKLLEAMTLSLKADKPLAAIDAYRRATALGMPHCPRCLRAVSVAYVRLDRSNLEGPMQFLLRAKAAGVDVDAAMVPLLMAQLSDVDSGQSDEHVDRHIRAVLRSMRESGLRVPGSVLQKAATMYSGVRNYRAAAELALMAAEAVGEPPGYSAANFSVLLDCYIAEGEPDRVAALVRSATEYGCWARMAGRDLNLLKSLKQWRRRLSSAIADQEASFNDHAQSVQSRALEQIEIAIGIVGGNRRQLHDERKTVGRGALDIVQAALLDAQRDNARQESGASIADGGGVIISSSSCGLSARPAEEASAPQPQLLVAAGGAGS